MELRAIRRLNLITTAILAAGLLTIFGGIGIAILINSETVFAVSIAAGFVAVFAVVLLSFAIDRVKCPKCGKPFNRANYRNWFARNFAKTQPRWSCAHCGYGIAGPIRR